MAIGRAAVYYGRAVHVFSAEIKCRLCSFHRVLSYLLSGGFDGFESVTNHIDTLSYLL